MPWQRLWQDAFGAAGWQWAGVALVVLTGAAVVLSLVDRFWKRPALRHHRVFDFAGLAEGSAREALLEV